jgi:hypothetical protein
LEFGSDKFVECEEVGVRESCRAAFVLAAGGFAERLRLNGGIKVENLTLVKSHSFKRHMITGELHPESEIWWLHPPPLQAIILSHHNSPSCSQKNCVDGQLELPVESTTGTCFLELYIQNILALQEASAGQSISDFSAI